MTATRRVLAVALVVLALVATGCGSDGSTEAAGDATTTTPEPVSSTSPETFWVDLEIAVVDFDADLDEIDADYLGRSWDLPDEPNERAEFRRQTYEEISDAYLDAWQNYVDRLVELDPPEGYPEAGEGYAEGLPDYFESAIVGTERAALAATRRQLDGDAGAFDDLLQIEDTLEDEWELFAEGADAVGHPIDGAVEIRMDEPVGDDVYGDATPAIGGIGSVLQRAFDLVLAIEDREDVS